MTDQHAPLWGLMHVAHMEHAAPFGRAMRKAYAAELRVIANEVVPDEPAEFPPRDHVEWIAWAARRKIRQRLLAAADEAEAVQ